MIAIRTRFHKSTHKISGSVPVADAVATLAQGRARVQFARRAYLMVSCRDYLRVRTLTGVAGCVIFSNTPLHRSAPLIVNVSPVLWFTSKNVAWKRSLTGKVGFNSDTNGEITCTKNSYVNDLVQLQKKVKAMQL